MRKRTSIATAGLLTIAMIGLTAPSSSAAFTTRCVGEGGAVTIPGDLVVPAGEACVLAGTTIQGDVRVNAGADLVVVDGTIEGGVTVRQDAYFDASTTSVGGAVKARNSFGNLLTGSSVQGAVTTTSSSGDFGFLVVTDSALGDRVRATGGALDLVSSTAAAQVQGLEAEFTDVVDSVVEGDLRVAANELGSVVCDSEVYGAATFTDNTTGVQLGGTRADQGLGDCEGANYFGADVTVDRTQGGVVVVDNIVRGDLAGTGNSPAPVGEGNRVRGELRGQFRDLQPPSGGSTSMRSQRVQERREELRGAAEQRVEKAQEKAELAGPAF